MDFPDGGGPTMDGWLTVAGLGVGFVVGLTGMGGGALMTPVLVLVFGVQPLAAVSSDLVASLVMKPFGAGVHLKRGTVNLGLVRWLVLGSVPSAFAGVLILKTIGGDDLEDVLKLMLGVALLVAATSIVARQAVMRKRGVAAPTDGAQHRVTIRPLPTLAIGVGGGLVVGMTSVGSGSLMIVLLLLLYPSLAAGQLVGTDLVQAIPLVGAAALGHLLFGDFQLALTGTLLLGAIPGVYVGARVSSRAPDHVIRPVIVAVLAVSSVKLLGASDTVVLAVAAVAVLGGLLAVLRARRASAVPVLVGATADPV